MLSLIAAFGRLKNAVSAFACLVLILSPLAAFAASPDPLDWPYWRGPEGNGISRETGLPDTIDPAGGEGSNLLWKSEAAAGRSTPVVMNGKLYTIVRDNPGTTTEREKVICLNAETGEVVWQNAFNVWSSDVPNTRVGWSSVVADPSTGNIYALGVCGFFQCINGETGKTIWSLPLHERFGLLSTYGGRTNFPIVVDDLVILGSVVIGWGEMAVPAHRFIAFDKLTGDVAWFVSTRLRPEDTIYSAPTVAMLGGQKLLLAGSGDGWVYAFQPRTGKQVWEYQLSRRGLNLCPLVDGDNVYMGHSEENPATGDDAAGIKTKVGAVVCLKGDLKGNINKTGEVWKQVEIAVGKASLLKVDDRLYCFDDAGKLFVLNAGTGEQIGKKIGLGTMNHASPVYADGKIYCLEKSRWYILTPDEKDGVKKFVRNKTMGMFPPGDECWASPVISHGRLYLQTTGALYCFADKSKKPGSTPRPEVAAEEPADEDKVAVTAQVVPAEVLLKPGDKQKFVVRTYNSHGVFLKEEPAKFTLEGPGEISEDGTFTAPADAAHVATIVTAKSGDIAGRARIRIVPPLPWKFDFEGLKDAPITWVGARYRHVLRSVDNSTAMVKITTIPRGTRSRLSMGQSDLHDYTIQTDFKAGIMDNKLPDVGLIAQGYTFAIEGLNKRIQLNSWGSHEHRFAKEVPFILEPNAWYTMKLRAENSDGKAVLRGKVWKRGEKEPAEWTVELIDSLPNTQGSPGMFGNATNAELYLDNVSVVPNE